MTEPSEISKKKMIYPQDESAPENMLLIMKYCRVSRSLKNSRAKLQNYTK